MKSIKNVLIIANTKKNNVEPILSYLTWDLNSRDIRQTILSPVYFQLDNNNIISDIDINYHHRNYDLIIPIGGDGTFLYTARTFLDLCVPIVGINAGRIGFLMSVNPDEISMAIDRIIEEKVNIEEKPLPDVKVTRQGADIYHFNFLNDAVVSRGKLLRMIEVCVSLNGEKLSQYRADGLIVSTATGSTAYNLSAGGPILNPDVEAMIISPICPHTLGVRPIVCSIRKPLIIDLIAGEPDTTLSIDGQENVLLKVGDRISIGASGKNIKLYDYGEKQYFNVLREKLGWHI